MTRIVSRRERCSRIVKVWTEKYTGRKMIKTLDERIWKLFDFPVYVDTVTFGKLSDDGARVCETKEKE